MFLGFLLGTLLAVSTMKELSPSFALLFIFSLTLFSGFWIANTLLTSLKSHKYILISFIIGFGSMVVLAPLFGRFSLEGLLLSYLLGTSITFSLLTGYIFYSYPAYKLIEFDFLNGKKVFLSLSFTGFFYNIAIWVDKFVFWFSPITGDTLLGPFRSSVVYDIPIFLAYLAIAPGMGFLFLKLEGEFANYCSRYYTAIREGETLDRIYELGYEMVMSVRALIQEVFRVQAIAIVIVFLLENSLFQLFGLSPVYIPLFNVLVLGTSLQLLVMAVLAILFYFDLRRYSLYTTAIFAVLNFLFSEISIHLGPYFYGYGFLTALLVTLLIAILLLRRALYEIHYRTFMLLT